MGKWESHEVHAREMQIPAPGEEHPMQQNGLVAKCLESNFAEKALVVLLETKLNMSQQCGKEG